LHLSTGAPFGGSAVLPAGGDLGGVRALIPSHISFHRWWPQPVGYRAA
jgi:hypothetical protein